ncbi:MAG: glucose 1-dehydrogenase [Candidatus Bipolaricaulota bacterium]|nr:glucose 1-dehydrogenase [Candidatus Bipolaricaulota bacterium]MDW8030363.1 glucose 1-dehydrogenase [Candidatus Bipolaricaulota bacterium]
MLGHAMDLQNRVALVTGSSRGIGRAIALELGRRGASVIVHHRRNSTRALAEAVAQELRQIGRHTLVIKANLVDPHDVAQMFSAVQNAFGKLDILVNNAASAVFRPLLQLEEKHWEHVWDVNLRAIVLCIKHAVPLMSTGVIVNITSLGSIKYLPNYGALGAAKAAIESLTRSYAVELAPAIRVNAVCGGLVDETSFSELIPSEVKERVAQLTPAGRMVKPGDIAKVVAFLCSDDAEMIRGQSIIVDGGLTLGLLP